MRSRSCNITCLTGTYTLRASTNAIRSHSPGDRTYARVESQLAQIGDERDALAAQIIQLLDGAAFDNRPIDHQQAKRLERQARALLREARQLAMKS